MQSLIELVVVRQGLSGEALTEAGHHWIGFDISTAMLGDCASRRSPSQSDAAAAEIAIENEVEGDVFLHDAGQVRRRPLR